MPRLAILNAEPQDAPVLAELHRESLRPCWSAEDLAASCRMPARVTLKACADIDIVGFSVTQIAADEAELLTIAVRDAYRRRGVASHLLAASIDACHERGLSSIYLEVACGNSAAQALYAALGFCPIGRRKAYYERGLHASEDAEIWKLDLSPPHSVDPLASKT